MSELILRLRQPAQIGDRPRDDFVLSTQEYLPGSVVRGAFAAAWLSRNGVSAKGTSQRAEFLRLFEGGVRFGSLLPQGAEDPSFAVISHKYEATGACQEKEYDRAAQDSVPLECPDCGSPLEQNRKLRGRRPEIRRRTSVSIHESGVAQRGALFTRESLEAEQEFRGTITAEDPGLLDILAGLGQVRVGGRRTTHGLAALTITEDAGQPPTAERRADGMLILRLRSPGIFTDDFGRPSCEPSPAELERRLGVPAQVTQRWTRWQQVGGWHIASGLPKPSELAVAAGSAYLISPERAVADDALTVLGQHGVGLRRHEGFGDLAPAPVLETGKRAREEKKEHLTKVRLSVAPLFGVSLNWSAGWPDLRRALTGHVSGDAAATEELRRTAASPPYAGVGTAVEVFLSLPLPDAEYVVEELRGQ
jgi:CRISPR-associated protein Csx10